jgi:hypothetical protein
MVLNKEEIERFYEFQKKYVSQWKQIVQLCEKQKVYFLEIWLCYDDYRVQIFAQFGQEGKTFV